MKHMNRILALALALMMVLGLATTAYAATNGSITISPPSGVDANATNTYKIYKVFEADGNGTNIAYKLVSGKTTAPAGFTVENGYVKYSGNGTSNELTADDIAAITAYITNADLVATVTATGSENAVAENLPNGYYYITTSTGSVVTINSTNPNATVSDKNTVPSLNKTITGANSIDEDGKKALAQIGTDVEYTATITVGKGEKNYVFHDKMSSGLTYNGDVVVTGIDATLYTIKEKPDADDTITITFEDGIAAGTVITIKYSAKINELALTEDPENNTAYVSYGDENSLNKTPDSETNVWNAKFTVTKQDGNKQPLAGAGFVLKNAENKYYKYTEAKDTAPATVEWVAEITDATEYTSDAEGAVPAFVGLANGTYTLIEKTVPAGYNKAADSTVTIEENNYTAENLEKAATVINNAGTVLPSTGGIGTTLFYAIGGLLVVAAVVLLVTKKRMNAAE